MNYIYDKYRDILDERMSRGRPKLSEENNYNIKFSQQELVDLTLLFELGILSEIESVFRTEKLLIKSKKINDEELLTQIHIKTDKNIHDITQRYCELLLKISTVRYLRREDKEYQIKDIKTRIGVNVADIRCEYRNKNGK